MELNNSELTFKVDKSFKGIILFGLVFFSVGLIASIIIPFIEPKLLSIWWIWIPVIIGYCIFVKMSIDIWRQRNNYVRVTDNSITLHSPENQIEIIKWNEILEISEHNILGRFTIKDKFHKVIRLEYQLENMSELLNIVANKIPHLNKNYSQLRKFRRTKHFHLFFCIVLIILSSLTAYSWYSESLFQTIILGGLSCLVVYFLLIEFIGVRIFDDRIAIVYPLWEKEIKFLQIKNILFEYIQDENGKSSPFVILKLLNDKKVKLNALREGTIALFLVLNTKLPVTPS